MSRFDFIKFDEEAIEVQADLKSAYERLAACIEARTKSPRYKALSLTALEESFMWVGKALRDDVIERNKVNAKVNGAGDI